MELLTHQCAAELLWGPGSPVSLSGWVGSRGWTSAVFVGGKVPLNHKKLCICSVFVLPPISLWVHYALMTSVMAEQIISGGSPSLSFAPWGNGIQQNVLWFW